MNEQSRIITESQWKEYQEFKDALNLIEIHTTAIGGTKKEMTDALLNIHGICFLALEKRHFGEVE